MVRRSISLVLLCVLVAAACSNGADPPTPTPTPTPTVAVADRGPEDSDRSLGSAADLGDAESTDRTELTEPPLATLADDDVASVTTMEAGTVVEDAAGNLVRVHRLGVIGPDLPGIDLGAFEELDLFGDLELAVQRPIGMLEMSWCAPGDHVQQAGGSIELTITSGPEDPLSHIAPPTVNELLIDPAFEFPEPARCSRGWAVVPLTPNQGDPVPTVARYALVLAAESGNERHVYQWELGEAVGPAEIPEPGERDEPADQDDQASLDDQVEEDGAETGEATVSGEDGRFKAGQLVEFQQGPLAGTSGKLLGWAELVGVASPFADTRLVGVLAEICPVADQWPEFGLSVEGWNLLAPLRDPLPVPAGSCAEVWIDFAVPHGVRPTGFFAAAAAGPMFGFASWSLDGAAIEPPAS